MCNLLRQEIAIEALKGNLEPAPPHTPLLDFLWINHFTDGELGIRGQGELCDRFMEQARVLTTYSGDDWPWLYLRMNEGVDIAQVITGFEDHYHGRSDED